MNLICCCGKSRKEGEQKQLADAELKLKNANKLLLEFIQEEQKLGLKNVQCHVIIESNELSVFEQEVPKSDIIKLYLTTENVNYDSVKGFFVQDFFFNDIKKQKYNKNKIILFNLLYTAGKDSNKANYLYSLLENAETKSVKNNSDVLLETIDTLTYIACIGVAQVILKRFKNDPLEQEFKELLSLYSAHGGLRGFTKEVISTHFFPPSLFQKHSLTKEEFMKKMESCSYVFLRPSELRRFYTNFALTKFSGPGDKDSPSGIIKEPRFSIGIENFQNLKAKKGKKGQHGKYDKELDQTYYSKIMSDDELIMNRTISEKSLMIQQLEVQQYHQNNVNIVQRQSSVTQHLENHPVLLTDVNNNMSPINTPLGKQFKMRLSESGIQRELLNQSIKQQVNINVQKDSFKSGKNNIQKYPNVVAYLTELFGEQFVTFVKEIESPFDESTNEALKKRLDEIALCQQLKFPDYNKFRFDVRQIFEYYSVFINKDDLIKFSQGAYYKESIINVYFKLLEAINLMLQKSYNYHKAVTRNQFEQYSLVSYPQKILYFNTQFSRRINVSAYLKECLNQLKDFYKYDYVILPFFINEEQDQRAVVAVIRVATNSVELYDRDRQFDNHDISDTILQMMDLASHMVETQFNEDQVDAGVESVNVDNDIDMLVAICYIAECMTIGKEIDMHNFNVDLERARITDVLVKLLNFK